MHVVPPTVLLMHFPSPASDTFVWFCTARLCASATLHLECAFSTRRRATGVSTERPERLKMNLVGREQSGGHLLHSRTHLRQPLAPDGVMLGFTLGRGRPLTPALNPKANVFFVPPSMVMEVPTPVASAAGSAGDNSQFADADEPIAASAVATAGL